MKSNGQAGWRATTLAPVLIVGGMIIASAAAVGGANAVRCTGDFSTDALPQPKVVTAPKVVAERGTVVLGERGERVAAYVESLAEDGFRGAVLAAVDGAVIAAVAVGVASHEGGPQPNTPDTLFEIASVTKPFTAAAVMRLVMEGRLGLDDSIAKHLDGVPDNCRSITIAHLLDHTSGIPGSNSQGAGPELASILPAFLDGGPRHEPGTNHEYWNQGYAILTEIIARAAGMPYTEYCRTALFAPTGMDHSCFTGDLAPAGTSVAIGRSGRGAPRSALDHPYGSYGFQYRGMGGLVTNVWDLWRWDRALHTETPLDNAAKTRMFTVGARGGAGGRAGDRLGGYALGWQIQHDSNGQLVQGHTGAVRGFLAEIRRYPNENAFVAVLGNRDDFPMHRVGETVAALAFGDIDALPSRLLQLVPELAAALDGRYEGDRDRSITIITEGGATRAEMRWALRGGPVTRARIGVDERGVVQFDDGSGVRYPLELDRDDAGQIATVSLMGSPYRRVAAAPADAGGAGRAGGAAGMDVMVALSQYAPNEHCSANLPPTLRWLVLPQYRSTLGVDDRITLVLMDDARSFSPVIALMDLNVAERLAAELQAMIEQKRRGR